MKPSERINEILKDKKAVPDEEGRASTAESFDALVEYLDGEWQKGACGRGEHEFKKLDVPGTPVDVCQKCHIVAGV